MEKPENYYEELAKVLEHLGLDENGYYRPFVDYDEEISPATFTENVLCAGPVVRDKIVDWLVTDVYAYDSTWIVQRFTESLHHYCNDVDVKAYFDYYTDDQMQDIENAGFNDVDYCSYVEELLEKSWFKVNFLLGTPNEHNRELGVIRDMKRRIYELAPTRYAEGYYNNDFDEDLLDSMFVKLIESQGYTFQDFFKVMCAEGITDSNFLASLYEELEEISDYSCAVCASVKMSGVDLAEFYDNAFIEGATISFDTNINIALLNPWEGSCGALDIQLEKPFVVSVKDIAFTQIEGSRDRDFTINHHHEDKTFGDISYMAWTLDGICGLCGSYWKEGGKLHLPDPNNL